MSRMDMAAVLRNEALVESCRRVRGAGDRLRASSDENESHAVGEERSPTKLETAQDKAAGAVGPDVAGESDRRRMATFEVTGEVEERFRAYCREKKVNPSRLVCALMFDFVSVRAGDKQSAGWNLVRNLEHFESARQRQCKPGRLRRRKRRLVERLNQLVTEVEAVFVGLDDGESSPIREEA